MQSDGERVTMTCLESRVHSEHRPSGKTPLPASQKKTNKEEIRVILLVVESVEKASPVAQVPQIK